MKEKVKNWLDSARYDLEVAGQMFRSGVYVYTVFMCHLALEKILKAKVEEITDEKPPKTHDLEYLIGLAKLSPDKDMERFISRLSNLSVATRYPDNFQMMLEDFSQERAKATLSRAEEVFRWIEETITL